MSETTVTAPHPAGTAAADRDPSVSTPPLPQGAAPGRELDAMVAEQVMGTVAWDIVLEGCSRDGHLWPTRAEAEAQRERLRGRFLVGDVVLHGSVPGYSTDIAAAWLVVEKLRADGWLLHIHEEGEASNQWVAHLERIVEGEYEDTGEDLAPTAPHAICLAALAALTEEAPHV